MEFGSESLLSTDMTHMTLPPFINSPRAREGLTRGTVTCVTSR